LTLGVSNVGKLKELWAKSVDFVSGYGGGQDGSPIEAGGQVFVGTLNHHLEAFNATTGKVNWLAPPGGGSTSFNGVPAYSGGLVFVMDPEGDLYAFRASNGTIAWKKPINGGGAVNGNGLTVAAGTVYVPIQQAFSAGNPGQVIAFSAATGKHLWTFSTGAATEVNSTPCVADGVVYITATSNNGTLIFAVDASNGKQKWAVHSVHTMVITSSPSWIGKDILVYLLTPAGNSTLLGLSVTNGKTVFTTALAGTAFGTPSVAYSRIYAGTSKDVYAIGEVTHKIIWTRPITSRAIGGVSVANGVAYFADQGTGTGVVEAVNAATGHPLWSHSLANGNISNSAPVIVNGSLYVTDFPNGFGNGLGYLYRFTP